MSSEVDWGAHETHQNEQGITTVDWGGHDPSLYGWMDVTEFCPWYTNKKLNLLGNALDRCTCKSTIKHKIADEKT